MEDKNYVNESILCQIIDKYVWNVSAPLNSNMKRSSSSSSNVSICPIEPNNYNFNLTNQIFERLNLPSEMFGTIKFRVKLHDEHKDLIMCKDFVIFNVATVNSI